MEAEEKQCRRASNEKDEEDTEVMAVLGERGYGEGEGKGVFTKSQAESSAAPFVDATDGI